VRGYAHEWYLAGRGFRSFLARFFLGMDLLLLKGRWARISMLVFCVILMIVGSFLFLVTLVAPLRDPRGWTLELILGKILMLAILFIPPAVGVRWWKYFTGKSVKSYFHEDAQSV
jgi:hypothetical protein